MIDGRRPVGRNSELSTQVPKVQQVLSFMITCFRVHHQQPSRRILELAVSFEKGVRNDLPTSYRC